MENINTELDFNCGFCDSQENFSKEQNGFTEILVHNLPNGITSQGVKNLFLNIGTPTTLELNQKKNLAYVVLDSFDKSILAFRDLHQKPPYHLKITYCNKPNKPIKVLDSQQTNAKIVDSNTDLNVRFIAEEITLDKDAENDKKITQRPDHIQTLFKKIDYSPSYKILQKKCDFQIPCGSSVSLGRGYFYLKNNDDHVGSLKNCKYVSENLENLFCEDYFCQNCNSTTTRICSQCSGPFCSITCLNESSTHSDCFNGEKEFLEVKTESDHYSTRTRKYVELKQSCCVVITMFSTLNTVFVRPADDFWEEKFARFCNDVVVAAFEANRLEEPPVIGELYCAKFYKDGIYYRGQVLSFHNNKISVYFSDFGNTQETNTDDLKPLPEALKSMNIFARKLTLTGIPGGTSEEAINYINNLTANNVLLILKYDNSLSDGVTLIEKDSGDIVNEKIKNFVLASWVKDPSVLSKIGKIFYLKSIPCQTLEVKKNYNLTISHINDAEFEDNGYLWLVNTEEEFYQYLNQELMGRITEYCEYLKDDYYLPRENELCLAFENEKWERCVCLNNVDTTCWLFFIDDGKTSFIKTEHIRKMIVDFIQCPQQAIRCVLSGYSTIKENKQIQMSIMKYLKSLMNKILNHVFVKNFENGDYEIVILEVEKFLAEDCVN